jgi:hypothetical protein
VLVDSQRNLVLFGLVNEEIEMGSHQARRDMADSIHGSFGQGLK